MVLGLGVVAVPFVVNWVSAGGVLLRLTSGDPWGLRWGLFMGLAADENPIPEEINNIIWINHIHTKH